MISGFEWEKLPKSRVSEIQNGVPLAPLFAYLMAAMTFFAPACTKIQPWHLLTTSPKGISAECISHESGQLLGELLYPYSPCETLSGDEAVQLRKLERIFEDDFALQFQAGNVTGFPLNFGGLSKEHSEEKCGIFCGLTLVLASLKMSRTKKEICVHNICVCVYVHSILSLSFLRIWLNWLNDNSCGLDSSHLQKELSQHFSLKKGDSWHTNGSETLGCWLSHPFIANRHPQVLADDVTCRNILQGKAVIVLICSRACQFSFEQTKHSKKVKTKIHIAQLSCCLPTIMFHGNALGIIQGAYVNV